MLDVNKHQTPDHPSTFMKMIKGRENKCQLQTITDAKF
jgi:hypothetical protein